MENQVFYFIYCTTNMVNGKIYVGKHKTTRLNDGYIGSGKLLKHAINKYGREFTGSNCLSMTSYDFFATTQKNCCSFR